MNLPLNEVVLGDCLVVLKTLPENSVDAIVSDPPYGLGTKQPSREEILRYLAGERLNTGGDFMGKDWEMPPVSVWKECLRVLKPGGHLLAFAGTRTFDMMSVGIKAAGFEDTDTVASMFGPSVLQWVYGAGFPKSLDISKAIDKMVATNSKKEPEIATHLKERREALGLTKSKVDEEVFGGTTRYAFVEGRDNEDGNFRIYLPTPEEWVKLKAVLKLDDRYDSYIRAAIPSREMRARADGGKSQLVGEEDGSYGYQQDGDRWDGSRRVVRPSSDEAKKWQGWGTALKPAWEPILCFRKPLASAEPTEPVENARFPRDDEQALGVRPPTPLDRVEAHLEGQPLPESSFYYTAKASKADRNQGLDEMWTPGTLTLRDDVDDEAMEKIYAAFPGVHREDFPNTLADVQVPGSVRKYFRQVTKGERGNMHVTVKPVALMRWLVRLVCPKNGIVLDPYSGSGTTLVAAAEEGINFVGIELDPAYHEIANKRAVALAKKRLTTEAEADIFEMMMGLGDEG
jgi:site-specific DNA-methyltransferase (adenine-specific)